MQKFFLFLMTLLAGTFSVAFAYVAGDGNFTGASGTGGAFIIGDTLTYIPPSATNGDQFFVDLSSIGLNPSLPAGTPITLTETGFDVDQTFTVTVKNASDVFVETFESDQIEVDLERGDFSAGGSFLGATGFGSAFKITDVLNYVPPVGIDGETFTADMTPIGFGASEAVGLLVDFDIVESLNVDYTGTLTVTATDDDGNVSTFSTPSVTVDAIRPVFSQTEIDAGEFLDITLNKDVLGIGDFVIVKALTDQKGDQVAFSADFSDVGGGAANYTGQGGDTTLNFLELPLENAAYSKTIEYFDDAGNSPLGGAASYTTNAFSIDLIRPVVASTALFTIVGGGDAVIGSTVQFARPTDTGGDDLTYDVDLTALGGENLVSQSALHEFTVGAGMIDDAPHSSVFTVYDEALNATVDTTDVITVDNKPADFNTGCGATFSVTDVGDSNSIADFSNGGPDTVTFFAPDNTLPSPCDETITYSIDLSPITGNPADNLVNQPADGSFFVLTVSEGNLDSAAQTLVLSVTDLSGNATQYSSGSFAIDNDVTTSAQAILSAGVLSQNKTGNHLLPGDTVSVGMQVPQTDIVTVSATIPSGSDVQSLSLLQNTWQGVLTIVGGSIKDMIAGIEYSLTDDAGNQTTLSRATPFRILNDLKVFHGGGGGSKSWYRPGQNFSHQEYRRHLVRDINEKEAAKRTKEAQKKALRPFFADVPVLDAEKMGIRKEKTYFDEFKERMSRSRLKQKQIVKEPRKMEMTLLSTSFFKDVTAQEIEKAKDQRGGFRLQNTLQKLRTSQKRPSFVEGTLRKSELARRGKVGTLREVQKRMVVR